MTIFDTLDSARAERDFLRNIHKILSTKDLSKLDLETEGKSFKRHSALFDNIELNITQTPVYYHKGFLQKLLGFGDWKFQPDVFERYEIYVLENGQNKRIDALPPIPAPKNCNVIMMTATMASDSGYFFTDKYDMRPNKMLYDVNPYLFVPAQQIYKLRDTESKRREQTTPVHTIPQIKTLDDLKAAQQKVLNTIDKTL